MSAWPMTREQLEALGYKLDPRVTQPQCSGPTCSFSIQWATTPSGKPMPLTVVQLTESPTEPKVYQPHWSDCPDRAIFRKRAGKNKR